MHFNYTTSAQLYIIRIHFFSILQGIAIFLEGVGLQDGISALQPHTPPPLKKRPFKGHNVNKARGMKNKNLGRFLLFSSTKLRFIEHENEKKNLSGV